MPHASVEEMQLGSASFSCQRQDDSTPSCFGHSTCIGSSEQYQSVVVPDLQAQKGYQQQLAMLHASCEKAEQAQIRNVLHTFFGHVLQAQEEHQQQLAGSAGPGIKLRARLVQTQQLQHQDSSMPRHERLC